LGDCRLKVGGIQFGNRHSEILVCRWGGGTTPLARCRCRGVCRGRRIRGLPVRPAARERPAPKPPARSPHNDRAAATQDPTRFASQQLRPFSAREQLQHGNPAHSPSTGPRENRCLSEASFDSRHGFSSFLPKQKGHPPKAEAAIKRQSANVEKRSRRRLSPARFPSTSHSGEATPQPTDAAAV